MTRHNLFDFATSELSQDAFLCWLAALANHEDGELQQLGGNFIAWLWSNGTGTIAKPESVQLVERPKQQWLKIDVALEIAVAGTRARIIIEDKTDTSHHGGQLERYLEVAKKDGIHTVPIYLKTGYHFGSDEAAARAGYRVIGLREWLQFLRSQMVKNDILADYVAHTSELLRQRDVALVLLSAPAGFRQLSEDFVQYEFMGNLAMKCAGAIGGSAIHRGINMGGTPWTHYRFARFPGVLPGGVDEVLFHRVDKRQDDNGRTGYYLSTRQYAHVKGKPEAAAAKLVRLNEHRRAFAGAVEQARSGLRFSNPANDFRGANESEIGILFFDEEVNTTPSVIERLPGVHAAFVEHLAQLPALPLVPSGTYQPG